MADDDAEHWFLLAEQYAPIKSRFDQTIAISCHRQYAGGTAASHSRIFRKWLHFVAYTDLTALSCTTLLPPPTPAIAWDALIEYHAAHNGDTWNPRLFLLANKASGTTISDRIEHGGWDTRQRLAVLQVLHAAFPGNVPPKREAEPDADVDVPSDQAVAAAAFLRDELATRDGRRASNALRDAVDMCVDTYYPHGSYRNPSLQFAAPYTALVGPSGMGKTFAVRQLAKVHGRYLIYTCLAAPEETSTAVPGATPGVLGVLHRVANLQTSVCLWTNYIRVGLALVEAAQALAIPPLVFFDLQADTTRVGFFQELAGMYMRLDDTEHALTRKAYDVLRRHVPMDNSSRAGAGAVVADDDNSRRRKRQKTQSYVLFCLDEARSLLRCTADGHACNKHDAPILSHGFRIAFQQYTQRPSARAQIFALHIDTSLRVAEFADRAFRPILTLPTFDVALQTQELAKQWLRNAGFDDTGDDRLLCGPDGSHGYQAFLFSLGRPLWGSIFEAAAAAAAGHVGAAAAAVRRIALSKLQLLRSTQHQHKHQHKHQHRGRRLPDELLCCLALLSYRTCFYVEDQDVAKMLVSRWMRFPAHLSDDRACLQTVQPSEPALVLAAQDMMQARGGAFSWQHVVKSFSHDYYCYANCAPSMEDTGEMVASVLLLLAADKLLQPPDSASASASTKMFPLESFLRALLPAYAFQNQEQRVAGLAGKQVYLTHISRFVDNGHGVGPGHRHLRAAFLAGQAWLLPTNTAGARFCVPVWDEHTKTLGGLLVQVKNRRRFVDGINDSLRNEAAASFGAAYSSLVALLKGPVYCLFMELHSIGDDVQWLDNAGPGPGPGPEHRPLNAIAALGCSPATYPCLLGHGDLGESLAHMLRRGATGMAGGNRSIEDLLLTRNGGTF